MHNQIVELINSKVSGASAEIVKGEAGDEAILIKPEFVKEVCELLKSNDTTPFNSLQVISGVDYLEYIEVNYILAHFDVKNPRQLILKTKVSDRVNGSLESVSSVWQAANWQERECYDMLGVSFNNHPDHRRILCSDDWEGYALRKDYVAAKYYGGLEIYPDEKMNIEDREFIKRQDEIKELQNRRADR